MLEHKEEDLKRTWSQVHEALKSRGRKVTTNILTLEFSVFNKLRKLSGDFQRNEKEGKNILTSSKEVVKSFLDRCEGVSSVERSLFINSARKAVQGDVKQLENVKALAKVLKKSKQQKKNRLC